MERCWECVHYVVDEEREKEQLHRMIAEPYDRDRYFPPCKKCELENCKFESRNMSKEILKQNYEKACNDYLRAFCEKHGLDYEDAFWCGYDIGGIADCSSYTFDMATIRTDIDEDAPKEELLKHYDYCLNALKFKLPVPNYHSWIHGCPRTSDEWFKDMRKMRKDFYKLINEEKERIEKEDKDMKF